tara:strand:+ start:2925 stop:3272 length:348 start_codon:yes stop_codon:yes gene_type:complete
MTTEFTNMIKEWVTIDNELRELSIKSKSLREKKNNVNNNVINYIETNNLDNAIIKISDGTLKFNYTNISQPLTFKYINECLNDIINDKNQVEAIINYIKNKRNVKSIMDIKRNYN